jgi:hypothetical protein
MKRFGDLRGRRSCKNRYPVAQTMAYAAHKRLTCVERVSIGQPCAHISARWYLLSNRRRYPFAPDVIALDPPELIDVRILWRHMPP